ncbi:DAK2 domain-containing protein, partial [Streptomyces sp. NPDC006129]|uniref:DAK2 domain-containing protein n=1 Tax=Streptomyces sp. NPDC006129 TaxID=3155348 RepID=UPI0033A48B33
MLDADFFRRWMTATAASVDREAERLTALDSPIGDADHGSNLQRGFTAVAAALEKEAPGTPGGVLTLAGRQLISTVGGTRPWRLPSRRRPAAAPGRRPPRTARERAASR